MNSHSPYAGKPNAGDCWNCLGKKMINNERIGTSEPCFICDGTGNDHEWWMDRINEDLSDGLYKGNKNVNAEEDIEYLLSVIKLLGENDKQIIKTADVIDAKNQDLLKEINDLEFANNEWKVSDKLWKETVEQLTKELDAAYKQIENLKKIREMSSFRHAQYAGELREEIVFIKKTADVIDAKNQELFNEIAEKDKEIRWLREEKEMLENTLQHYRGHQ